MSATTSPESPPGTINGKSAPAKDGFNFAAGNDDYDDGNLNYTNSVAQIRREFNPFAQIVRLFFRAATSYLLFDSFRTLLTSQKTFSTTPLHTQKTFSTTTSTTQKTYSTSHISLGGYRASQFPRGAHLREQELWFELCSTPHEFNQCAVSGGLPPCSGRHRSRSLRSRLHSTPRSLFRAGRRDTPARGLLLGRGAGNEGEG
jgi:hypothetical protein